MMSYFCPDDILCYYKKISCIITDCYWVESSWLSSSALNRKKQYLRLKKCKVFAGNGQLGLIILFLDKT